MHPETPPVRNEALWRLAHQRVAFRRQALSSLLTVLLLTAVWYFTTPRTSFWPAWVAFGLGTGLLFRFVKIYFPDAGNAESEYRKLRERYPK